MFDPGHRTERKPPFRYAVYTRVAFSDTDAQGVVYYGRYLPYFDLARTEYHRELGEIDGAARNEFVMRASTSSTTPPPASTTCSRSSCASRGSAARASPTSTPPTGSGPDDDDTLMVTATQTNVLIDHDDRRTVPVPDGFRAARRRSSRASSCDRDPASKPSSALVENGGEPDDVLRAVVERLVEPPRPRWAGILFVEGGELVLGPQAGAPDPGKGRRCRSSTRAPASPSSPPTAATTRPSTGSPR